MHHDLAELQIDLVGIDKAGDPLSRNFIHLKAEPIIDIKLRIKLERVHS